MVGQFRSGIQEDSIVIKITLSSGVEHYLQQQTAGSPDFESYSSSIATQDALQAAFDRGDWEPYEPPQVEPEPIPPNWPAFRMALLKSATFRSWSKSLEDTWREDLKLAAIARNAEALQETYNHCVTLTLPGPVAVEEWQQIATENHIPVTFIVASE